jgi:hypothetical protein
VTNPLALQLDADALELSLEKRLKARAARADCAVRITPEMLRHWVQEELELLVGELATAHNLAHGRQLN